MKKDKILYKIIFAISIIVIVSIGLIVYDNYYENNYLYYSQENL